MPDQHKTGELKLALINPQLLEAALLGDWAIGSEIPEFDAFILQIQHHQQLQTIKITAQQLGKWDSRLVLFLYKLQGYCKPVSIHLELSALPEGIRYLLTQASAFPIREGAEKQHQPAPLLQRLGLQLMDIVEEALKVVTFVGEVHLSMLRFIKGNACFRKQDLGNIIQECGPHALPIVTLISILVGLILAFVGAIQLRLFGAEIYVANLVGLGMAREMGAMMTAIIMAGRTGAAFASQLGSMQTNEEIDALNTLGISAMDFLVLPRMLALILMLPLLCLYADLMGILGGFLVSFTLLDISFIEYYTQTKAALDLNDFAVGLIKSAVFGVLVAVAGCINGLQCGRSSSSVGDAATAAVVASIVAIVVADALLTIIYEIIGI